MTASNLLDFIASPNKAKQDKVDIEIGTWTVRSIAPLISEFIACIGTRERDTHPKNFRAFYSHSDMIQIGNYKEIEILSSNTHSSEPRPLFSGKLRIRREIDNNFKMSLRLSINPTRFCAYQARPRTIDTVQLLNTPPRLFAIQNKTRYQDEYSLGQTDNVLLDPTSKLNGNSQLYATNLNRYLIGIIDYLANEIEYYSQITNGNFQSNYDEDFSLRYIEHYWEVSDPHSIYTVRDIRDAFIRVTNNNQVTEYTDGYTRTEGPAISLRCDLRTGEKLKIYAKTNKRIRIEISYKFNDNARLAGGSYTYRSLNDLTSSIISSQENACDLVNQFIPILRRQMLYPEFMQSSASNLVRMLYRTVGDIPTAEEILGILLASGGIPRKGLSHEMRMHIKDLESAGIVEYVPRPMARYIIERRFTNALNLLNATTPIDTAPNEPN